MIDPPTPPPTNPEGHRPGISHTLEENAARTREQLDRARKARRREAEEAEEREREAISRRLDL